MKKSIVKTITAIATVIFMTACGGIQTNDSNEETQAEREFEKMMAESDEEIEKMMAQSDKEFEKMMAQSDEESEKMMAESTKGSYNTVIEAVKAKAFDSAHELLKTEYTRLPTISIGDYYMSDSKKEAYDTYISNVKLLYREEASILINNEDVEAETVFFDNLSDLELGLAPGTTGVHGYSDKYYYEFYNQLVGEYNDLCVAIVKKALLKNKKEFAEKIVFLMRPAYNVISGDRSKVDGNHCLIEENTEAINKAKALLKN